MQRGFIGGFLTGAVLSVAALGMVSVLVGFAIDVPPSATTPQVPAGSQFNQAREDRAARLPAPDDIPGAETAPVVAAPSPDDLSPLKGADTAPTTPPPDRQSGRDARRAARPGRRHRRRDRRRRAGAAKPAGNAARGTRGGGQPEGGDRARRTPAPDAPQESADEGVSEGAEASVAAGSISAEPAQPPEPEVETGSGLFGDADRPGGAAEDAGDAPEPPEPPVAAMSAEEEPSDDRSGADAAASGTIGDLAQGVTTGRLPAVTDAPATAEPEPEPATAPALERFAAPFENPEGKPVMAIVLIDDGTSPVSFEALADFPYPISYAIDAGWPGAAEAARNYRAAGLEVLALVDLPEGAGARDTEVAMQSYLRAVPPAVAVMEGVGTGLQSSREAAAQLVPILQDAGLGLVLFSEGLDTTRKLIAREGVPVASVFRDFDAEGQNARVIRRFLDQAAFRAAQEEGGVVMVGRLRAETVSALLLWGLQDRAGSVALAPVSAVLKESVN
ncbi:MAG: divergent polysaccharide deacetylase family protein [Roseovarius sp.]|nr:divergent polysaccharide deacetylase family protein [Roseovarius sp.]